ncbi:MULTISPECIES: ACT domain-containing protein [unclassified Agarivorans]|uniref:ACT domain-containing protein n=2 Tax=Bacteria TaxID=2 RepID=UPI0026E3C4EC|nr:MULTISPECIES: ACT domain-containing protein [unclassified Agarivorans]MDO6683951.1 ACT domain-containing protein [Agarivorans sp. 3_MG-2023]MDO6714316.1 ACT domain-containing protein [Agarivorans sp. 2_MG-2023]
MSGVKELALLLGSMKPKLLEQEFVFCTQQGELSDYLSLKPLASFVETEGLTLILEKQQALLANLHFDSSFKQITLTVHSSLEAVGLTAAVATKLAERGISANVVAAFYHDHIFVPAHQAEIALRALQEFSD